jgi:hypothetical protein
MYQHAVRISGADRREQREIEVRPVIQLLCRMAVVHLSDGIHVLQPREGIALLEPAIIDELADRLAVMRPVNASQAGFQQRLIQRAGTRFRKADRDSPHASSIVAGWTFV